MSLLPIPLPDVRKLERTLCLPEWLALRMRSMRDECQRALADGKYRTIPTLPFILILTKEQRVMIEQYISDVDAQFKQTPAEDIAWERATLAKITELFMGQCRNARLTAVEAEIAGNHYLIALRDVPTWAVDVAIEKWVCGLCGTNEQGLPYDYEWRPGPATLRKIALGVTYPLKNQVRILRRLLLAEPLIEFGEEHCASMRARVAGLIGVARA